MYTKKLEMGLKITDVETYLLKVPIDPPIADSISLVQYLGVPLIKITTGDGVEGWGFNWTIGGGAEFVKEMLDRYLIKELVGKDVTMRRRIIHDLSFVENFGWDFRLGRTGLAQMALAAVDMALWDVVCKKSGLPLWRLLGGEKVKVEAYNTHGGWLSWSLEELVKNVKDLFSQGYKYVKIKVGKEDPFEDYERVKAVREAIGHNEKFMIDANTKWDVETALRLGRRFEEFDVFWLEEPLTPLDVQGHKILAKELKVPIAVGESLYSRYSFNEYISNDAADIFQIDITKLTGITEWLDVASLANSKNVNVYPHTNIQQPVHVQLVAASPSGRIVEHVPWMLDVWKYPLEPQDGYFTLPEEPGIGTEVREDAIEKYGVKGF